MEPPQRRLLHACLLAAALAPLAADASFNSWGDGPCRTFGCYFLFFGVLLGAIAGIPFSFALFGGLNMFFHHPARSKGRQSLLGACLGIVAFEAAAAVASAAALWVGPDFGSRLPQIGFLATYLAFLAGSFLYARSAPRPS